MCDVLKFRTIRCARQEAYHNLHVSNLWMFVEELFHFHWINVLSTSNDHVLYTSVDSHVTIVIHPSNVPAYNNVAELKDMTMMFHSIGLTRCVAMPMYDGRSSMGGSELQSYFSLFMDQSIGAYRIKFACAGVSVVCNTVFRLMM